MREIHKTVRCGYCGDYIDFNGIHYDYSMRGRGFRYDTKEFCDTDACGCEAQYEQMRLEESEWYRRQYGN